MTSLGAYLQSQASDAILSLLVRVPIPQEAAHSNPAHRVRAIARTTASKVSLLTVSLSLPPGVLGWAVVLPEMMTVWKLQAQMVVDIAAVYGQQHQLRREHLLYCLFKQISAHLLRDMAVRSSERLIVTPATQKTVELLALELGRAALRTALNKRVLRFIPLLGTLSASACAYYDTLQVAFHAETLFKSKGDS